MVSRVYIIVAGLSLAFAASPPGPGPFGNKILQQPVKGALSDWKNPKMCEIDTSLDETNATSALQIAIDSCGDRAEGGIVVVKSGLTLYTASLFLRSNLTLRIEYGAALVSTATGYGDKSDPTNTNVTDAPMVYTRRNSLMMWAHAGMLNGGSCIKMKDPLVGWDDCAEWQTLENVVLEGGGLVDAAGDGWYDYDDDDDDEDSFDRLTRPMMLDLLWINGLTIRDLEIRRPGYWTVHPTFCNNVVIFNNSIVTYGSNTDGCDPDSSWNVLISQNYISTGDDCIAIKAGRDWSGRMVNISTRNVLAESNTFGSGHGVSIGSETSGWVLDVIIRDSVLNGTDKAVRIKSARGRGGGAQNISYSNSSGAVEEAIQISLFYEGDLPPTNWSATPEFHDISVENLAIVNTKTDDDDESTYLECIGLNDSSITNVRFTNVKVAAEDDDVKLISTCTYCNGKADDATDPTPCFVDGYDDDDNEVNKKSPFFATE